MMWMEQKQLADDLLLEILSWLPVRSIHRFKYVSKSWFSLITSCSRNPSFAKNHLNHSKQIQHDPTALFFQHKSLTISPVQLTADNINGGGTETTTLSSTHHHNTQLFYRLSYNEADEKLETVISIDPHEFDDLPSTGFGFVLSNSCNGLIIVTFSDGVSCLWNPCTQEFKRIPVPPFELPNIDCDSYRRARHGLAYDPILDDYKAIEYVLTSSNSSSPDDFLDFDVMVYTLGTNSWRWIPDPYKLTVSRTHISNIRPLYLNGAHHWLAFEHWRDRAFSVLSFDIAGEEYREVPKPPFFDEMKYPELHLLRGCLCIFAMDNDASDVWVMRDYGVEESWTKLFSTAQLVDVHGFYGIHFLKPLWSCKNSDGIFIENESGVILYDPQRDEAKLYVSSGTCPSTPGNFTQVYTGSFVSLKTGTYVHVINKDTEEKEEYKKKMKKKNKDLR